MHILTGVKHIIDPDYPLDLETSGTGFQTAGAPATINPYDEVAVEAAIRLKEGGVASRVTALGIGPATAHEAIRQALAHALAMGADDGILIETPDDDKQMDDENPHLVAALFRAVLRQQPDIQLVMTGSRAAPADYGILPALLAGLMDWPQLCDVTDIPLANTARQITAFCQTDNGLDEISCDLPCIISPDLNSYAPRYLALPAILQARRKPVEVMAATQLLSTDNNAHALPPRPQRLQLVKSDHSRKGERLSSAQELFERLQARHGLLT